MSEPPPAKRRKTADDEQCWGDITNTLPVELQLQIEHHRPELRLRQWIQQYLGDNFDATALFEFIYQEKGWMAGSAPLGAFLGEPLEHIGDLDVWIPLPADLERGTDSMVAWMADFKDRLNQQSFTRRHTPHQIDFDTDVSRYSCMHRPDIIELFQLGGKLQFVLILPPPPITAANFNAWLRTTFDIACCAAVMYNGRQWDIVQRSLILRKLTYMNTVCDCHDGANDEFTWPLANYIFRRHVNDNAPMAVNSSVKRVQKYRERGWRFLDVQKVKRGNHSLLQCLYI